MNDSLRQRSTERSRNLVKHLIGMGYHHIDNDFGKGTSEGLLRLYEEYFNAMDADRLNETEETAWRLDIARNMVYGELRRGLRIGLNPQ